MRRSSVLLMASVLAAALGLLALIRIQPGATDGSDALASGPAPAGIVQSHDDANLTGPSKIPSPAMRGPQLGRGRLPALAAATGAVNRPAPRLNWHIVFTPDPPQPTPLSLRIEPDRGNPASALSRPWKDSDVHEATVRMTQQEIESATLLAATTREALDARDGRPVVVTEGSAKWAFGSLPLQEGNRDDWKRTVTGLRVMLREAAHLGELRVSPIGLDPLDVLVWTAPKRGYPCHVLIDDVPPGEVLALRSFVPTKQWFADVSPGEVKLQSERVAIGNSGDSLVLMVRQR